jgi:hypothetical protein
VNSIYIPLCYLKDAGKTDFSCTERRVISKNKRVIFEAKLSLMCYLNCIYGKITHQAMFLTEKSAEKSALLSEVFVHAGRYGGKNENPRKGTTP